MKHGENIQTENNPGTVCKKKHDISNQLGAYYDMRYLQYFTRLRFLFEFSEYDEDDTVHEREEAITEPFRDYDSSWDTIQNRKIQEQECESQKRNNAFAHDPIIQILNEMSSQKEDLFKRLDKIIDEFLLNTYLDIDERELMVCRTIVWTMWDLNSGHNLGYYCEVVARLLDPREARRDIFPTIKDIEDTIQILAHKGILTQDIDRINNIDMNGNTSWRFDEPFITLSFAKDSGDVMRAISEGTSREMLAFFEPHTYQDIDS